MDSLFRDNILRMCWCRLHLLWQNMFLIYIDGCYCTHFPTSNCDWWCTKHDEISELSLQSDRPPLQIYKLSLCGWICSMCIDLCFIIDDLRPCWRNELTIEFQDERGIDSTWTAVVTTFYNSISIYPTFLPFRWMSEFYQKNLPLNWYIKHLSVDNERRTT